MPLERDIQGHKCFTKRVRESRQPSSLSHIYALAYPFTHIMQKATDNWLEVIKRLTRMLFFASILQRFILASSHLNFRLSLTSTQSHITKLTHKTNTAHVKTLLIQWTMSSCFTFLNGKIPISALKFIDLNKSSTLIVGISAVQETSWVLVFLQTFHIISMNRWHMILPSIIYVQPKYSNASISQNISLKKTPGSNSDHSCPYQALWL